ncbi:MAG: ribose 5-phosphate isomerase B [Anaerolineaceae bacterium]|jgi:ribose 5-phosphate isomerase B
MSQFSEKDIHNIVTRVLRSTLGVEASPEIETAANEPALVPPTTAAAPQPVPTTKTAGKMVAIGTDHGGLALKELLIKELRSLGYEVTDCGTNTTDAVDYPDIAYAVASLVAEGKAWRGVIIDGAGIGSCMAANKVPGIRAALCYDYATAVNSREHNDANVLTLGAGLIGNNLAKQILSTWLATEFGGGRHTGRVNKIIALEKRFLKDGKTA